MAIIEYNDEQGIQRPNTNTNAFPKFEYVKLKDGPNKVRLIGNPISFFKHSYLKYQNGKPANVICIGKAICPICIKIGDNKQHKNKASRKNVRWVIDRADGKIKLLEYGQQIKDGIQALFQNEDKVDEKGTPFDYDIVIIKGKGEGNKVTYSVQDAKKIALTASEQEGIEKLPKLTEVFVEKTAIEIEALNLIYTEASNVVPEDQEDDSCPA